jgi:hypothetical protein
VRASIPFKEPLIGSGNVVTSDIPIFGNIVAFGNGAGSSHTMSDDIKGVGGKVWEIVKVDKVKISFIWCARQWVFYS